MSLKSFLSRTKVSNVKAEADTQADDARVDSRVTGGVVDESDPNQGSTTSSTQDGGYVGRIAGDDVGYAGETGAERRAEARRLDDRDPSDDDSAPAA